MLLVLLLLDYSNFMTLYLICLAPSSLISSQENYLSEKMSMRRLTGKI